MMTATGVNATYFTPALSLAKEVPARLRAETHRAAAMLADRTFTEVAVDGLDAMDAEISKTHADMASTKLVLSSGDSNRRLSSRIKDLSDELKELTAAREEASELLQTALRNYAEALRLADLKDNSAFRFCALWLANHDNDKVNEVVASRLSQIPTHFFLPLVRQLTARIMLPNPSDRPTFAGNIYTLVRRLCLEHPFHTLYHVVFLATSEPGGGDGGAGVSGSSAGRQKTSRTSRRSMTPGTTAQTQRTMATEKLVAELASDQRGARVYRDVRRLCDALIDLSGITAAQNSRGAYMMPSSQIASMRDVQIPPPTCQLPVSITGDYKGVPTIVKFASEIDIAGGLSRPKIMTCRCTGGLLHKMLVRAFAVPAICSHVLRRTPAAQERRGQRQRPTPRRSHGASL